jgi:hypothetical protein
VAVPSVLRLPEVEQTPAEREQGADERDRLADERDRLADERDRLADQRDRAADDRDRSAGRAIEVEGRPVPAEVDDDPFGINFGPSAERTEAVDSDSDEPPSPETSPRTLTERLAAAAVDRDYSDKPKEGERSAES